jgi:hypothetical protein
MGRFAEKRIADRDDASVRDAALLTDLDVVPPRGLEAWEPGGKFQQFSVLSLVPRLASKPGYG